jgi:hypothetical protein
MAKTFYLVYDFWSVRTLFLTQFYQFLKDWRVNVLGQIKDARAELLNVLEDKWERERDFGDQWILCDQLIMAVALDRCCVLESEKSHVMFSR